MTLLLRKGSPDACKAAVVVPFRGEKYLLVKGKSGWELPGGKIERGENAESAARRELAEETGYSPRRLRYVCRGGKQGECAIFTCELESIPAHGKLFAKPPSTLSYGRAEFMEFLGAAWRARTNYDEVARYFDSVRGTAGSSTEVWLEKAFEALGKPHRKIVADIGCGSGRYALGLADLGCEVVGVDLSEGMLKEASRKGVGGKCGWVQGDAQSLPLKSKSADCALMFLVIHHVPLWREALAECACILKPGGIILIVTTSRTRLHSHSIRFFPGAKKIDQGRFQGIREIKGVLSSAGFTSIKSERVTVRRGNVSVDKTVERFRNKHISTLALVPNDEFAGRLEAFERRLKKRYGAKMPDETELTFISGRLSN